jgi:hypothetical protein
MRGEDLERAWRTIAENRIQAAIEAGEFDRLPGLGQPIDDLGDLHDQNWWLRAKLRRENLIPHAATRTEPLADPGQAPRKSRRAKE